MFAFLRTFLQLQTIHITITYYSFFIPLITIQEVKPNFISEFKKKEIQKQNNLGESPNEMTTTNNFILRFVWR